MDINPWSFQNLNSNFDLYSHGFEVMKGLGGDEIEDRIRWWLEGCNHLQGIEIILDSQGGYVGIADEVIHNKSS